MHLSKKAFLSHIQKTGIMKNRTHVLIAVSGGMDSMVLLHILKHVSKEFELTVSVGHINHHLRESSGEDQNLVENICRDWNVPTFVKSLNPKEIPQGESIEAWARKERYSALENIRTYIGADTIITAHHGNDQVETILMHLADGCGLDGLIGIRTKRGNILRPFLAFTRTEIDTYARFWKIPFCEDETNRDLAHPRNFLRHKIIRKWEEKYPSLIHGFVKTSEQVSETAYALESIIPKLAKSVLSEESFSKMYISHTRIKEHHVLLQSMILKYLIGDSNISWRRHQWNDLKQFLQTAKTGQTFQLNKKWICLRDREYWLLEEDSSIPVEEVTVQENIATDVGDSIFEWKNVTSTCKLDSNPMREIIDGEKINNKTLVIRPWRAGDEFTPLGMNGTKKVSDFLVDEKIDLFSKKRQLVLTADEEIIWVCGRRISDEVKLTKETTRFVELSLRKKG